MAATAVANDGKLEASATAACQAHPPPLPEGFVTLRRNVIAHRPARREPRGGNGADRELCACDPSTSAAGGVPCCSSASRCYNVSTQVECSGYNCRAGPAACSNRAISRGKYPHTVVRFAGSGKGWALFAGEDISEGTLVAQYLGEVVPEAEMKRRVERCGVRQNAC